MTHEELKCLKSLIDEIVPPDDVRISLTYAMKLSPEQEHFKRLAAWITTFKNRPIQTTRADIFKLGEIVGTIETLLTIEEKQK